MCLVLSLLSKNSSRCSQEDASPANIFEASVHMGVLWLMYCSIWKDGAQGAKLFSKMFLEIYLLCGTDDTEMST